MSDRPDYVYVASSWRNPLQTAVCAALRSVNIDHYDFKKAGPEDEGFRWTEVMPEYADADGHTTTAHHEDYLTALGAPRSGEAFELDMGALRKADTTVLVLPCNRSAHLELGYAVGAGQRTAVLLDPDERGHITPELMYLMVDYLAPSLFDLLGWLGVED